MADNKLECRNATALEFPVEPDVNIRQTMSSAFGCRSGKTLARAVGEIVTELKDEIDRCLKVGISCRTSEMVSSSEMRVGLLNRVCKCWRNKSRRLGSGCKGGIGHTIIPAGSKNRLEVCFKQP